MARKPPPPKTTPQTSQYDDRLGGGFFHATFDFKWGKDIAAGIAGDMKRADPALLKAHHQIALELQEAQARAFATAVQARHREQRVEVRKGPMFKAIISKKNRSVNLKGFTVGYLDNKSRFPHVALYANGLEGGTSVHVNRPMQGLWITHNGLAGPIEGALDAIGFAKMGKGGAAFTIHKAIEGYGFQRKGFADWKKNEYDNKAAVEVYEAWFETLGMDFAARLFSRTGKKLRSSQMRARFFPEDD